jgi:neopullulanase
MRIVLDGVFNHASRGFWQFHHVLETGAASPYRDWFHFDPDRLNGRKNWGAYPTPHESHAIQQEGSLKAIGYQGWWDLPALPKFKTETPAVREFLLGVAEHWIRFGIDGWRLDVPGEINDDSFWQEFRRRVRAINPQAYIVGEIWHEAQRWLQGDQFDATMNYLVTAAALSYFGGPFLDMGMVNQVGGYLNRIHVKNGTQFGDEIDRLLGLYGSEINEVQFNLLDSHDTVRFLSCVRKDKNAFKLALLFIHSYPGAPCIYYGDEIGMDGGHDPDSRRSFPPGDSHWDQDLLAYTKACIKLRKDHSSLRRGSYHRLASEGFGYAFGRRLDSERLIVAFNAGEQNQKLFVPLDDFSGGPYISIFGRARVETGEDGLTLRLAPRSSVVLKSQK